MIRRRMITKTQQPAEDARRAAAVQSAQPISPIPKAPLPFRRIMAPRPAEPLDARLRRIQRAATAAGRPILVKFLVQVYDADGRRYMGWPGEHGSIVFSVANAQEAIAIVEAMHRSAVAIAEMKKPLDMADTPV